MTISDPIQNICDWSRLTRVERDAALAQYERMQKENAELRETVKSLADALDSAIVVLIAAYLEKPPTQLAVEAMRQANKSTEALTAARINGLIW